LGFLEFKTSKGMKTGAQIAQKVRSQYQSSDPQLLAQKAGLRVQYGTWHPCTWGEYDARTQFITINTNAPIPLNEVLLHELGHYFLRLNGFVGSREMEEFEVLGFVGAMGLVLVD
jgi:Zn-dependent peptidase ImmA (M78 family)